jgi:glutamine synthetase adenylyltransferase
LGKIYEDILSANTLIALEKIFRRNLLTQEQWELLKKAYEFYRRLEFHLASSTEGGEGCFDPMGDGAASLAVGLGFKNREDFLEGFTYYRRGVRKIYLKTLKVQGP